MIYSSLKLVLLIGVGASAVGVAPVVVTAGAAETHVQIDVAPRPNQKAYSPADGQIVEVTPPPFIWVPASPAGPYVLQVSRSSKFEPGRTRTYRDITTSVYVPREPLEQGAWFWRYGVQTESGDVFGRARPFMVPDDASPFPFPDF